MIALAGCGPRLQPVRGAPGIGDAYYPELGNGGYDVEQYVLVFDIDPARNILSADESIQAEATQYLSAFNLDFQGFTIDKIIANGVEAPYQRQGGELTITPVQPLPAGSTFSIHIKYHGNPGSTRAITSPDWLGDVGWFHGADGSITTANDPSGASLWFAVNDHPRDKATYRFDIRVPQPWVAVAPGVLRQTVRDADYTRSVWTMDQPMASYVVSINIGEFSSRSARGPNGLKITSYFASDVPESEKRQAGALPEMIEYFTSLFGPYPFEEYGVLVAGDEICSSHTLAEEVQGRSIYCPESFDEQLLVHELAHQWFGNSVTLEVWQDAWMKEGMATYAEWLWSTRDTGLDALNRDYVRHRLGRGYFVPTGAPDPADLYAYNEVYEGGALVFHALRLEVGDDMFFQILRAYLEKYRYGNAGRADLIAVAEKVSGRTLKASFDSWLMEKKAPAMPGF